MEKNYPEQVERIVGGVAEGCVQAGCAIVGGETAEMAGFYDDGENMILQDLVLEQLKRRFIRVQKILKLDK